MLILQLDAIKLIKKTFGNKAFMFEYPLRSAQIGCVLQFLVSAVSLKLQLTFTSHALFRSIFVHEVCMHFAALYQYVTSIQCENCGQKCT